MRKRKAFLGVGLACALLLTMLAGCGAQESSAAPTSEASVKTEQTESQSGNVFNNPDVSIGEGTITVLTNVTEGNRLKELEKYAQEFDANIPVLRRWNSRPSTIMRIRRKSVCPARIMAMSC